MPQGLTIFGVSEWGLDLQCHILIAVSFRYRQFSIVFLFFFLSCFSPLPSFAHVRVFCCMSSFCSLFYSFFFLSLSPVSFGCLFYFFFRLFTIFFTNVFVCLSFISFLLFLVDSHCNLGLCYIFCVICWYAGGDMWHKNVHLLGWWFGLERDFSVLTV